MGFRFKLAKSNNCLSAIQIRFNKGFSSPVFKAVKETEDDMQTFLFEKGQKVRKHTRT